MKLPATLILVVLMVTPLFAQEAIDQVVITQKVEKYKKMKDTGAMLSVGGSVLTLVGFITMLNSSISTIESPAGNVTTETRGYPGMGTALFLLGHAGLGAGIPLYVVGKNNERKYNGMLQGVSLKFNVNPRAAGLSLSCKL